METNNPTLEQKEIQFFYHIKKELSLENAQDAVRVVAAVLQAFRQTLTLQNADALLNKLPDFLKLVFASNWKREEPRVAVEHLDEFVSLVMDRERGNQKSYFNNEVQALSVVILTLKKLYRLAELETFEGLSNAMRQELREVSAEAAA